MRSTHVPRVQNPRGDGAWRKPFVHQPFAMDRHLTVRFFMDKHRQFVDTILVYMRSGDWDAYRSHLTSEAPKYEADFRSWLNQGPVP